MEVFNRMLRIIIYLIIINIVSFMLYGIDKHKAIEHKWRISEKTLILSAVFGGSIGAFIGMWVFHHKTKHPKFYIGVPAILIVQLFLSVGWYVNTL